MLLIASSNIIWWCSIALISFDFIRHYDLFKCFQYNTHKYVVCMCVFAIEIKTTVFFLLKWIWNPYLLGKYHNIGWNVCTSASTTHFHSLRNYIEIWHTTIACIQMFYSTFHYSYLNANLYVKHMLRHLFEYFTQQM